MNTIPPSSSGDCRFVRSGLHEYFDGEIQDPSARRMLDAHTALCTACQEELSALRELRVRIQSVPRLQAPASLRERLLAQARAVAPAGTGAAGFPAAVWPTAPSLPPAAALDRERPAGRRRWNWLRVARRAGLAAAVVIAAAGVSAVIHWKMQARAQKRLAAMQSIFLSNVDYYNSTHYYYDLGEIKSNDPSAIEAWYARPAQMQRLGFKPVLPRWSSMTPQLAYVCQIRQQPAAIIWYDWKGVRVALHVQKASDAIKPFLADFRRDVVSQAVTVQGLMIVGWRAADIDYVVVVPEENGPAVLRQIFSESRPY
ncbi:MAG: hypothetical protein Kow0059_01630 [Candidatus Sumerlaeia bacterium]